MQLLLTKIFLCVLINLIEVDGHSNSTFRNVSVEWSFSGHKQTTHITASNYLRENVPNITEKLSASINGLVPILHEKSIADLVNVESLTMSNVGLEKIEAGAFENLPDLKYLVLSHNIIHEIYKETFRNLNLSVLNLDNNDISVLHPEAFKDLHIWHLTLSYNKISEIGKNVFKNVSLTSLQLYGNGLHNIEPKAFHGISGLTSLVLSNNQLEEISPAAFDLPELTSLDLNFNSINSLQSGSLKNLPNLTTLELVSNKLTEIPEGVFNHSKLSHLKLNYNTIAKIAPQAFDDMSALSVLHIDHNNLTEWDINWLFNSQQLAYIFAGFNDIQEIPDRAFKNYPRMFSINLQGNNINTISSKTFDEFESVVNFGLSDNKIDDWDPALLDNVKVGTLDLSGNKLRCMEGNLESVFRNVHFVLLQENPWKEECKRKIDEFIKSKENISAKKTVSH